MFYLNLICFKGERMKEKKCIMFYIKETAPGKPAKYFNGLNIHFSKFSLIFLTLFLLN